MTLYEKAVKDVIFRKDYILHLCKNKDVLHLGFVQHSHLYEKKIIEGDWLHSKILSVARRVVGVDYLEETVCQIRKKYGYEVYVGDVMRLKDLSLNQTFDVIIIGELIEHIENPGIMLNGIKRFCNHNSLVVITTPNPWSLHRIHLIQKGIFENKWLNPEHVMWFSYQTLNNLLNRTGFRIIEQNFSYAETRQQLLDNTNCLFGQLRLLWRIIKLKNCSKYHYDGLFFIASPAEEFTPDL